jgi:hypothetical protein
MLPLSSFRTGGTAVYRFGLLLPMDNSTNCASWHKVLLDHENTLIIMVASVSCAFGKLLIVSKRSPLRLSRDLER